MKISLCFLSAHLAVILCHARKAVSARLLMLLLVFASGPAWAFSQAASTTTLAITSAGGAVTAVTTPAVVTLTAAVTSGGSPVTHGVVNFCYSAQPSCIGAALAGAAQLTGAGSASISFRPAVGSHSYTAVFAGTASVQTSTSAAGTLTVTQGTTAVLPTSAAITSTGTPGDYTVTGAITGDGLTAPTGTVNFVDVANGTVVIGSGTLSSPTKGPGFLMAPATTDFKNALPLATGDFNGDGIADLIATLSDGTLVSQLGNGDGSFTTKATIPGGASQVAVGDFNSDGKLDIAVSVSGAVSIFLGDGTGNFTAVTTGTAIAVGAVSMAVADFNHDGNLDLALTDVQSVYMYMGNGDGTFTAGYTSLIVTTDLGGIDGGLNGLMTGDFNGDGVADMALAWILFGDYSGTNAEFNITYLFGDGAGNFTPSLLTLPTDFLNDYVPAATFNSGSMEIQAYDSNGDGMPDLFASFNTFICCPGESVTAQYTVLSNGGGTFTANATSASTLVGAPLGAAVVDVDGNGTTEVTTRWDLAQEPAGIPEPPPFVTYGGGDLTLPDGVGTGFLAGDFNGDGVTDLALGGPVSTSLIGFQTTATATATHVAVLPPGSGTHPVEASYGGDATHSASVSAFTVGLESVIATPVVTLSGPASVAYGSAAVITVTVTSGSGYPPTGTATLLDGAATAGTSALSNGVTTFTLNNLSPGVHSLTASYGGDLVTAPGTSAVFTLTVTATPTLTVSTPTTNVAYGSAITFTATLHVTGVAATGSITFKNGNTPLGNQALGSNGVATLTVPAPGLPVGGNSITASFAGDSHYAAVTSSAITVTVTQQTPTLALTSPTTTPSYGSAITFTATLTVTGVAPTGSITFKNGSTTLGSQALGSNGVATLIVPAPGLPVGNDSVTASFAGNTDYAAVTSAPLAITVSKSTSVLTLAPSAAAITVGTSETLVATLPAADTAGKGTVTFYLGSATLGSSAVSGGSAMLTTTTLPAGMDSITAIWTGDSNFDGATSAAVLVTVAPTLTLTASSTTIYTGQTDSITVTLGTGGNTVVLTGTITLTSGSYTSGAATLAAGSATIEIPANTLPTGSDTLVASYSGDTVYPAGSGSVAVTVSTDPPPGFTITAPSLTIAAGATSSDTVQLTFAPVTGFTGTVDLTAQVTGSPADANDPPTVSLSNSSVTISGASPATATLTVKTTASTTAHNDATGIPGKWLASGGAVLAGVFLLGIPRRRKRFLRHLCLLVVILAGMTAALAGCGGAHKMTTPGTTAGTYTITVTGKSGAVTSTGTIKVTVQ